MVPHKSRLYRAILDLSFILKLAEYVPLVNNTMKKMAQKEAMNQIGGSLLQITAAMAEADDNEIIFYAKRDIKDGFWRLVCKESAKEYSQALIGSLETHMFLPFT